jgi:hypothetical protein
LLDALRAHDVAKTTARQELDDGRAVRLIPVIS